ncbi:MAG: hypothetical protein V2I51_10745 [Anderseniella sp.]|jgi:hypothetical protein|nr:hypothetical protein [Anderseniella sp.]
MPQADRTINKRADLRINKASITACVALVAAVAGMPVAAAQQGWTCSYDAAGGLAWKNGQWSPAAFAPGGEFELRVEDGGLSAESAAAPMSSNSRLVDCRLPQRTGFMCIDPDGSWLLFNPRTGKGAVSKIYTALKAPPNEGSTLSVEPFTCRNK